MKKYLSRLLVLMLFFTLVPMKLVKAEEKPELEVKNAVVPSYEMESGDLMQFGMTLKNNSEGVMKEVKVKVEGGFFAVNEAAVRVIGEIAKGAESIVKPFLLRYNGGDDTRIIVKVTYKLGSSSVLKEKTVIFSTNAKPGKDADGVPANSELYKPVIVLEAGSQPVITGSESKEIKLSIKNDSRYNAKDINITGLFSESKFELGEISPTKRISTLKAEENASFSFVVRGKSGVEKGIYPIKMKYEVFNEYGNKTTGDFEIYVKYIAEEVDTDVELVSEDKYEEIISGEDFKLNMTVINSSKDAIDDVKVELVELKSDNIINKYSNYKSIDKIEGGKKAAISIDMISNENTATGNYPIKAVLKFEDKAGNEKQITRIFFRKVEKTESEIFVGGLTSSKSIVKDGDEFVVTVPVYNYGEKKAENLRVVAEGATGIMNISSNVVLLKEIGAGNKEELQFRFKVAPKAAEGNKLITVKVIEGEKEKSASLNVYTESAKADNKSVPKIIISKYSSDPVMVKAGKNFELSMSFMNSHSEKEVKNIKITLQARETSDKTGSVFSPVNSSNTFFIDEIDPKAESIKIMTMYTIPDAKSKTYIMDVKMEYEDAEGNQYSTTDQIGLPVRQISKFMTSDIRIPEMSEMNRGIRLDIDISNTGKIDLSNFTVKVEGDFMASNSSTYVGTIAPGQREYYDVDLTPTKEGINNGTFIFTYEEPSGDVVEVRKDFSSNAQKPYVPEFNPEDTINNGNNMNNGNNPIDNAPKGFPTGKVLIGVGIVAVLILIIVLRKRAKKKKEMELDE